MMTRAFVNSVVHAVMTIVKNFDDEVESVCNLKLGEIHETLATIKTESERKTFAVTACKNAWLNHLKAENVHTKHRNKYQPPFNCLETVVGDDDSIHTVQARREDIKTRH
jgi:hypothetical protein